MLVEPGREERAARVETTTDTRWAEPDFSPQTRARGFDSICSLTLAGRLNQLLGKVALPFKGPRVGSTSFGGVRLGFESTSFG